MEAREGDVSKFSQVKVVEKLIVAKSKLMMMKDYHYSLRARLQVTQKKLERVRGEFKERKTMTESLREASKTRQHGRQGQKKSREK